MRLVIIALALTSTPPALAQTVPAATDAALVSRVLGAIWRPLSATGGASAQARLQAACEGAIEEMAALELSLPEDLGPLALAQVRTPRGLLIVPTAEDPSSVYIFPSAELGAITSGLGRFRLDPAGAGRLVLRDAAGRETQVQLGSGAGHTLMRLSPPGAGEASLFVGCAPTTR